MEAARGVAKRNPGTAPPVSTRNSEPSGIWAGEPAARRVRRDDRTVDRISVCIGFLGELEIDREMIRTTYIRRTLADPLEPRKSKESR
jgi:hypothetical protein